MWFAGSYEGHEGALFEYPCEEDKVRAFAIEHSVVSTTRIKIPSSYHNL
mgnify:FL=1